jgi:hypothetical protein
VPLIVMDFDGTKTNLSDDTRMRLACLVHPSRHIFPL